MEIERGIELLHKEAATLLEQKLLKTISQRENCAVGCAEEVIKH